VTPSPREDPRLTRLAEICATFPDATREDSGRHAGFRVRNRTFAYFLDDHRGNEGIVGVVFKPPGGESESLMASDSQRFYKPAYIWHRGWVGLRLDTGPIDWDEVAHLVAESYLQVAPKRLAAQVEGE
jgi:predicted DNA-binding protein (MmcQ/YjbR family)